MPKYCPSCGTEVKEGFKFCLSCGAQLQAQVTQTPPPPAAAPAPPPQQPTPPPIMPQQSYTPIQPKKTNTKLIVGIIVAIVAVVVVLLVVFLFLGGGSSSADLVGTWTAQSVVMDGDSQEVSSGSYITLQSGGTYVSSGDSGTWEVRNNKLYIVSSSGNDQFNNLGLDYQISNNRLTLSYSGIDNYGDYHTMSMVFTKN